MLGLLADRVRVDMPGLCIVDELLFLLLERLYSGRPLALSRDPERLIGGAVFLETGP